MHEIEGELENMRGVGQRKGGNRIFVPEILKNIENLNYEKIHFMLKKKVGELNEIKKHLG